MLPWAAVLGRRPAGSGRKAESWALSPGRGTSVQSLFCHSFPRGRHGRPLSPPGTPLAVTFCTSLPRVPRPVGSFRLLTPLYAASLSPCLCVLCLYMFHMMHMSSVPHLARSNWLIWLLIGRTLIWGDFLCVFSDSIIRIFYCVLFFFFLLGVLLGFRKLCRFCFLKFDIERDTM